MKIINNTKVVPYYGTVFTVPLDINYIVTMPDGMVMATRKPVIQSANVAIINDECYQISKAKDFVDEWQDSLVHCPEDMTWLLYEATRLRMARSLLQNGEHAAFEMLIKSIETVFNRKGRDYFLIMEKHVCPEASTWPITETLRNKLFPEEVTRTFNYLGFPVTVPSWANWVATNADGAVYAYHACPIKDDAGFKGVQSVCVGWRPSQFASQWQSSLLEV